MDHKVSKDMISSGMIPSGEKTQADLGRTQYGSAPSPSSLMDAYRSIYEHHQKDKDGNTIPHEGEQLNEGKMPEGLKNYLMKKGKKDDKKDDKKEKVDEAIVTGSLLAAKALGGLAAKAGAGIAAKTAAAGGAKAVAGKAAMGLAKQTAVDKAVSTVSGGLPKLKKKEPIAAGVDLFDIVKGRLLDEGLTEEESMDVMLTLTLDEINEVIQLDEVSSELLMKAAKGAEVARGKAAVAGDKAGAVKKMKQGEKFYKGAVEKRKASGQMGAGYKESK